MDARAFELAREHFVSANAAFEAGRLEEAESGYRQSLALLPARPSTTANLARLLLQQQRASEVVALVQPVAAASQDLELWRLLATAHEYLGEATQALQALDRAIALDASQPALHERRGIALQRLGRLQEAMQAWQRATTLDEHAATAWACLGTALCELGRHTDGLNHYERALQAGADPGLLGFQMAGARAALSPRGLPVLEATPAAPPRDYVRGLFDGYAAEFDEHLARDLDYRAPEVLAQGLVRLGPPWFAQALDLGCGTGLCAVPLGPLVGRLDGVDLSPAMLAAARRTERYTRLHEADLLEHLQGTEDRFDLVVSADVFIYVGVLDAVFEAVRRVLRPRGVFCFSVEQAADEQEVVLQASLRYAHSAPYLRRLAKSHGLKVLSLEAHPLRRDLRHAVQGLYGWLRLEAS